MPYFPVSDQKRKALQERMKALGLRETDIKESFLRSSGPGGQHVNKVSTCVVLRHMPTGLEVRCQRERSQSLNRFLARRLLVDKLDEHINRKKSEALQRREKIRRQKRRRSQRAKAKMLENKRRQSEKKRLRSFLPNQEE
jgi:protein subunit release factor B